jgi:acetyl-CoA C-acetyltransferase
MKRAAIVSPLRTPVGAYGGALKPVPVEELGAIVARCDRAAHRYRPQPH